MPRSLSYFKGLFFFDFSKIQVTSIIGFSTLAISLSVLVCWIVDISLPSTLYGSVKFNTALCFAVLSASLLNITTFKKKSIVLLPLKLLVILICTLNIIQNYFDVDLGIDQFFITDHPALLRNDLYPGRFSPMAALLFIFLAVGLTGVVYLKKYALFFQYLFHLVTFASFVIIVGFLLKMPALGAFFFNIIMSFYTAMLFFVFSIGASLLNPSLGITAIFTVERTGNIVAKKLFLQLMFGIITLTYLRFQFQNYFVIDPDYSFAVTAISVIVISLYFTWKAARSIDTAEQKRKIAEEYFKLVVESAPNALVMTDDRGVITLINAQGETLFGYTRDEILGEKIEILIPERFRKHHPVNRAHYHKEPAERYFGAGAELHAVNKSGVEFPVEIGLNPVKSGDKTVVLASIIDISERKRQEILIKKQLIELRVKNQEMEQFNYIASHDLQEPLRTVSNYIMLLEEDYPDQYDGEVTEHLHTMEAAVQRMSLLVRSMLDFGRLGRNKVLAVADCNLCVSAVIADLGSLIKKNNATVTIENALPVIALYEMEFRQLLQNLINNAIKFSQKDVPPVVKIGCKQVDDSFEFYVSDNGIGIHERHFNRIFQIFQRLDDQQEFEGHGIGLANCKKIAEMHGGKIWVESRPGAGSLFKFTISKF